MILFDSGPPLKDDGGPTPTELIHLIDQCDLSNSRHTTPSVSPAPQLMSSVNTAPVAAVLSTPQSLRRQFLSDGCDQPACFSGGTNVTSSTVSESASAFVPRSSASSAAVSNSAASLAAGCSSADSGSTNKASHVDGNNASNKHWELLPHAVLYSS